MALIASVSFCSTGPTPESEKLPWDCISFTVYGTVYNYFTHGNLISRSPLNFPIASRIIQSAQLLQILHFFTASAAAQTEMASSIRSILDRVYLVYFLIHIPVLFCKRHDFHKGLRGSSSFNATNTLIRGSASHPLQQLTLNHRFTF